MNALLKRFNDVRIGVSKRDGIYPDLERECRVFYQCSAQLKTREAHCPGQLRFNSLTNRCDSSANIIVPCGTYYPVSAMSAATTSNTVISSTSKIKCFFVSLLNRFFNS